MALIVRADARAIPLRDACVQTVVTSPPYWGLRDYGVPGQIGLEASPEAFVSEMVAVFREVRRVLKDDGTLWLNLGDSYATGAGAVGECPGGGEQGERWAGRTRGPRPIGETGLRGGRRRPPEIGTVGPMTQPNRMPIQGLKAKDLVGIPWRVAFALQADGWWLRSDIVWSKPNPMPESVRDRPTKSHEYVFLLCKSERYLYNADAISEPVVYGEHHRNGTTGPPIQVPGQPVQAGLTRRRRSGNKERQYGGKPGQRPDDHLGRGIPWEDKNGRRNRRTVWQMTSQPYRGAHYATMPETLARLCILAGSRPGDVVFDPFLGSGTTAKVAIDLGRVAVGIDLNRDYLVKHARRRTTTTMGLALFSSNHLPPPARQTDPAGSRGVRRGSRAGRAGN